MKRKDKKDVKSVTFALIIIILSLLFSIGFLQYRIVGLEKNNEKYAIQLPPNGTKIFQPSPSPTKIPMQFQSRFYPSATFGISLEIPSGYTITSLDNDKEKSLQIFDKAYPQNMLRVSTIKKIRGYGGPSVEIPNDCKYVQLPKLEKLLQHQFQRCITNKLNSTQYSIEISYPSEQPLNLYLEYLTDKRLTAEEFRRFDMITDSIQFLSIPKGWNKYSNSEFGFDISYPSTYNVITEKLSGWPHAILLLYNGGQAYDIAIELWTSKYEMESILSRKSFPYKIFDFGEKYISISDETNEAENSKIISTMQFR